jgi:hypothetical protein
LIDGQRKKTTLSRIALCPAFDRAARTPRAAVCCDPAISDACNLPLMSTIARRYAARRLTMLDGRVIPIAHM